MQTRLKKTATRQWRVARTYIHVLFIRLLYVVGCVFVRVWTLSLD